MCGLMFLAGAVPANVQQQAWWGAMRRGPHSHGVAAWGPDGWQVGRAAGRLDPVPVSPWPHEVIVAHARLATSTARPGDMPDPDEGQPLVDGRCLVAHNGTLADDELEDYDGCVDSGAILRAVVAGYDVESVYGRLGAPQAILWSAGKYVDAIRIDGEQLAQPAHPLYVARGADWCAASSGPLPGGRLIPAGRTHQLWRLP